MATTASTPTTTPAAMPATLVPPLELESLVGCAPDADASAGLVTTTVVWPGRTLVTIDGLVCVGVRVEVGVGEDGDDDEVSPPKVGTLDSSPVNHTVK